MLAAIKLQELLKALAYSEVWASMYLETSQNDQISELTSQVRSDYFSEGVYQVAHGYAIVVVAITLDIGVGSVGVIAEVRI